jgi:ABC-type transport system substrate-binding protein
VSRIDRYAVGGLVLALAVVGAAMIAGAPSGSTGSANPNGAVAPYREGVLGHPNSINPLTVRSQADQDLVALLFRGLVKAGPDGTVEPDLATWTVSPDGLTYTFQMRQDAYWEDGQPVSAADVVFTIGLIQNAAYDGPVGSSWQGVRASEVSPYVVSFTVTLPIAGFLRQAELPILPSHLLRGTPVATLADSAYSSRPIGDGPYRIIELDYEHALLERVPTVNESPLPTPLVSTSPSASASLIQFATATPAPTRAPAVTPRTTPTPPPAPTPTPTPVPTPTPTPTPSPTAIPLASGARLVNVSEIELVFYDDPNAAAADFHAGKLDAVGGLTPQATDAALSSPDARQISYQWASLLSVVVNQRSDHPELRDVNARTGLLAAIDRSAVLSKVLEGRGSVADLPIPNWSPFYDPASVVKTPYDVSAAEGFLTTAGWTQSATGWTAPKGQTTYTLELLTPDQASNPVAYGTALLVDAAWTAIGFTVQLDAVPAAVFMQRLDLGDFSTAIVSFDTGLDPDLGPMLLSSQVGAGGSNVSGVEDSTLDQLILTAHKTVDPADRQDAVSAVEKYVSTTLPILPLAFRDYDLAVTSRLYGVVSNQIGDPSGRFWDVLDWRLASDR